MAFSLQRIRGPPPDDQPFAHLVDHCCHTGQRLTIQCHPEKGANLPPIMKGSSMLSHSFEQPESVYQPSHVNSLAVQDLASLEKIIHTFFEVEAALRREGKMLHEERHALLHDLDQSLQRLCEWVSVSTSTITPATLRRSIKKVCNRYAQEVQCWAEENSISIGELLTWIEAEQVHIPRSDQHASASVLVSNSLVGTRFSPTLSEDDASQQARLLKALADQTRLRILSLLSRYEGEACVFEIVEAFPLEQPTISHHLRILRDAGLVDCRKKGLWAYYYVKREALRRACDIIEQLA